MPSLITTLQNEQYKSALKKNFSVLSQAFRLAYGYNYDDFRDWEYAHSAAFTTDVYNKLSQYLYIQKNCGTTNRNDCWADKTLAKNGQYSAWFQNDGKWNGGSEAYGFVLNDGTSVFIDIWANGIINSVGISKNIILSGSSLGMVIDVNGKKGPNTVGKDIHAFALTTNGLVPAGIDNNSAKCEDRSTNNNFDCTAKMLK